MVNIFKKKVLSLKLPDHPQAQMTITHCNRAGIDYSLASFKDFEFEYGKAVILGVWRRDNCYTKSHFCADDHSLNTYMIHSDVIIFEGVGMVFRTEQDLQKFKKWEIENEYHEKKPSNLINKW